MRVFRVFVEELSPEQIERIEKRMRLEGFLGGAESLIDVISKDGETLKQLGISHEQIADRIESLLLQANRIATLDYRRKLYANQKELEIIPPYPRKVFDKGETAERWSGRRGWLKYRGQKGRYVILTSRVYIEREHPHVVFRGGYRHLIPRVPVEEKFIVGVVGWGGDKECPFEDKQGNLCPFIGWSSSDHFIDNINRGTGMLFPGLIIHLIRDHHFFEGSVRYRLDPAKAIEVLELEPGKDYSPQWEPEFVWRSQEVTVGSTEGLEHKSEEEFKPLKEIIDNPDEIINLTDQVRLYLKGDTCVSVSRNNHYLGRALTVTGAGWESNEIRKGVTFWRKVEDSHVVGKGYETPQRKESISNEQGVGNTIRDAEKLEENPPSIAEGHVTPSKKTLIFADPNLETAVRSALGKQAGSIDESEFRGITELDVAGWGIHNITGLERCTGLTLLNLGYNQIIDISPLSNLNGLVKLGLSDNKIRDLSPLSNLINLERILLEGNQIADVSPLSNLMKLEDLNLDSNLINDVSPISRLTNLRVLRIGENQITDLSPLSELHSLEFLSLRRNRIVDVSPLSRLAGLNKLILSHNTIKDISSLSKLTGLSLLDLQGCELEDITHISSFTGLSELYLGYNKIKDITALSNLKNVQVLGLESNRIADISIISGLTYLIELRLMHNNICDISALSSLTGLRKLFVGSNNFSDISPISYLTSLEQLELNQSSINDITPLSNLSCLTGLLLAANQIRDITPLSGLRNLTELNLKSNKIENIAPIASLSELEGLSLDNNQINDIAPLVNLRNLERLFLSYNCITDIAALSGLTSLSELHLNNNRISDASPLFRLSGLIFVDLYENPITGALPTVWDGVSKRQDRVQEHGKMTRTKALGSIYRFLTATGIEEDRNMLPGPTPSSLDNFKAEYASPAGDKMEEESPVDGPTYIIDAGPWRFQVSALSGAILSAEYWGEWMKVPEESGKEADKSLRQLQKWIIDHRGFSLEEATAKAEHFVGNRYRRFKERNIRLESGELKVKGQIASYIFTWKEYPLAGETAVFPNSIVVKVHPIQGTVLSYRATDLNVRFKYSPAITRETALQEACAWLGEWVLQKSNPPTVIELPHITGLIVRPRGDGVFAQMVWQAQYSLLEGAICKTGAIHVSVVEGHASGG